MLFIAREAKCGAKRLEKFDCWASQRQLLVNNSNLNAGFGPAWFLRERNKKRQGEARTSSSKGESRGRAKARTNKARKLTHRRRLRDGAKHGVARRAKHGVAQSKPDRERKADRVVEAKHEVCRRTKQSTTSSKHSTQHDAEAKHYM